MDSRIEIYDNLLSENDCDVIRNTLISQNFPWSYGERVAPIENNMCDDLDDYQFIHNFYWDHKPQSDQYDLMYPLIQKIPRLSSLVRIKANLNPRNSKVFTHGFHIDMTFKCTTGIYYINTNNGYTEFEDGTKIESIRNRFISFPSDMKHTGSTCSDKKMRLLINFNYFQGEPLERGSYNANDGYYHRENKDVIEEGEGLPSDIDMKELQDILSSFPQERL